MNNFWNNPTSEASCKPLTPEMIKDFFVNEGKRAEKYNEEMCEILNDEDNIAECKELHEASEKLFKMGDKNGALLLGLYAKIVMSHPSEKPVVNVAMADATMREVQRLIDKSRKPNRHGGKV